MKQNKGTGKMPKEKRYKDKYGGGTRGKLHPYFLSNANNTVSYVHIVYKELSHISSMMPQSIKVGWMSVTINYIVHVRLEEICNT